MQSAGINRNSLVNTGYAGLAGPRELRAMRSITEKRQQDRATKPVRAMLIHHQGVIVWHQCPMIIRALFSDTVTPPN